MLEAIGGSGFYRSVVGWHVELECKSRQREVHPRF
jgi:hypothetical protein